MKKRNLGAEILEGLRHIKSGAPIRVTTWTSVSDIRGRIKMHNPPHPGETLRSLYLEPLGLSVSAAAVGLDVSRKTLSAILNAARVLVPKWRSAYRSPSRRRRKAGSISRFSTISGRPRNCARRYEWPAWPRSPELSRLPLAEDCFVGRFSSAFSQ